jgi:alpha-ketoglutaric semialdehyde dehydrogenase
MTQLYENFIGGRWLASSSARRTPNRNPADASQILGEVALSTRAEAALACDAAARAYPAWRNTPAPRRGALVAHAAQLLAERREQIAQAITREEGKLIAESRGELLRGINNLEFSAGEGRRLGGATIPLELPNNFGYTLRVPVGPCALITPWNFPVGLPAWKLGPALVAGNTVVFKPSPLTPEVSQLLVQCFADAGIPDGVLNLVHGDGEAGTAIVDHPAIRAVSFTGSTPVGQAIYQQAARRGIRAQCEMGGKNPVIVMADADLDLAAAGIAAGAFGSTGQRCTATSRVVVVEAVADALLERLLPVAQGWRAGNGLAEGVDMGPVVDERQLQHILGFVDDARAEGAELLCGGARLAEGELAKGFFVGATIFDRVAPDARLGCQEVFGPVLAVQRVKDFDEAIAVANATEYGLTSSIYTSSIPHMFRYINEVESGMTHVNSPTLGGEAQVPFGGTKATAVGPFEQSSEAFSFYTETKVVYVDYTGSKREGKLY